MRRADRLRLQPGRVYRTCEFTRWDKNPTRLVKRLEREGRLVRLAYGFYRAPDKVREWLTVKAGP